MRESLLSRLIPANAADTAVLDQAARDLHQQRALTEDILRSSMGMCDQMGAMALVIGGGGLTSVTKQLMGTRDGLRASTKEVSDTVSLSLGSLQAFSDALSKFEQDFSRLTKSISEIERTVSGIHRVAFQSKILALNARIEASRFGDAGAGFNVVAQEVGEMARQVAEMSNKIGKELEGVRVPLQATRSTLGESASSIEEVSGAMQSLSKTVDVLTRESDALAVVTDAVEQVAFKQVGMQDCREHMSQQLLWVTESAEGLMALVRRTTEGIDEYRASLAPKVAVRCASLEHFEEAFYRAIMEDEPQIARSALDQTLKSGTEAEDILTRVGVAFQRSQLQAIGSTASTEATFRNAEILREAVERLDKLIGARGDSGLSVTGTIVLGNAFEDYHDLGRRMIGIFLRSSGFRVVDLGMSVSNQRFVDAVREHNADVVGVSALLLHTASEIPKLKRALSDSGFSNVPVIAGGAPFLVDPHLGARFGADAVGRGPRDAVRLARYFVTQKRTGAIQ
jgi:methylmalonyl-CoA mutase cobalamin-binding domain/chain